jgi:hypothetical protein
VFTIDRVKWIAWGLAAIVIVLGLHFRFDYALSIPPKPPAPVETIDPDALRSFDAKPETYRTYLEEDQEKLRPYHYVGADGTERDLAIPKTSSDDLEKVLPYEQSQIPQTIDVGSSFETSTLKLSARTDELDMRMGHEGTATFPHLILRIENKTDSVIAFNIVTTAAISVEKCMEKSDLPGDQLVLPPHGFVERTECIYMNGMKVTVNSIEVMQLPAISFFYVSRLNPSHIGIDKRFAGGHHVPFDARLCTDIPEQAIHLGMKSGQTTWRDIIDFYARHNCDRYNFYSGYKAFSKDGQIQLPAVAP